ncbi:hypothetical protein GA0115254_119344 [Streptomyces sp. Ncost-T10-10d]|nr:hypothetical protein GA0115254_119344 [Streptomyces sp. Ncost-T10-10d]
MTPDVQESSAPGSFHTIDSLPVPRRRASWREALSRTFGAVDITVPDEVYSGTIRRASLGRLQAVTVDGDCQFARRTRRLVTQDGAGNHQPRSSELMARSVVDLTGCPPVNGGTPRPGPADPVTRAAHQCLNPMPDFAHSAMQFPNPLLSCRPGGGMK